MSQRDLLENLDLSISSAEDFLASPFQLPARSAATQTSDGYGPSLPESFAKLTPDGVFLKTSQDYCQQNLDGSLEEYSETWPPSGFLSSGKLYRRPMSERRICAEEFGLLPTPTTPYGTGQNGQRPDGTTFNQAGKPSLDTMARHNLWPTPTAGDAKSSGSRNLEGSKAHAGVSLTDAATTGGSTTPRAPTTNNGQLNPEWVALLMGYPRDWVTIHGWKAGKKARRGR